MSRQDRIAPQTLSAAVPDAPQPTPKPAGKKKFILGGLAVVVLAAGGYYGAAWWKDGRFMIETDDAYVQADLSLISAKITGYVDEIAVTANQHVASGDLLLRIDDGDYRIAREQAQARLSALGSTIERINAQIAAAESAVVEANAQFAASEAVLLAAQQTAERITGLAKRSVVSKADLDAANEGLATAEAKRNAAKASITGAQAQIDVLVAQRLETQASERELTLAVAQAERNLGFTELRAPFDGTVANIAIKEGELVSAGARLAAVVPDAGLYVEANFKETQLGEIRVGQTAHVEIDALASHQIEGKVISIAPATGTVFSLLPAENATGNFTKIVQRVPVRIELPAGTPGLRAGLSAVIKVDSRTGTDEASAK